MPLDPLRHPDLARLGRRLRETYDDTLDAEQAAALAAIRRRRSLRDVLLEASDRGAVGVISCGDGQIHRGVVTAVGSDHVVLGTGEWDRFVALEHIVSLVVQ